MSARSRHNRRAGFSLTELLVVIGIIILLVSIGLPTYFAVRRNSDISRTRMDLRTLEMGIEEYRRVFNELPKRVDSTSRNERLLFKYLISRDPRFEREQTDGRRREMGIRGAAGGRTWGPFVNPETFKAFGGYGSGHPEDHTNFGITDRFGNEIMYYPRYNTTVPLMTNGALVGNPFGTPRSLFNDNDGSTDQNAERKGQFYWMLGAKCPDPSRPDTDINNGTPNRLNAAGDLTFNGDFVLISAGPDRKWGPQDKAKNRRKCDDVYNFEHP